jgi:short-subunit dehydrogenase
MRRLFNRNAIGVRAHADGVAVKHFTHDCAGFNVTILNPVFQTRQIEPLGLKNRATMNDRKRGRTMTQLLGKRVLITGAGHGLGRELAKTFGKAGCEIIVTDRELDRVAETVGLLNKSGCLAFGYAMDVTNSANVLDVHERIHAEHGPIDLLVNNAGIVSGGTFEHVSLARHKAIYDVNAFGPIIVTHTFLSELIARPESHIVNIASASALLPLPFAATYAASKWAVLGFSESLLEELKLTGHDHVRVTSVCPGYISSKSCEQSKPIAKCC